MRSQPFEETFWMARRYAEGRMTYVSAVVNTVYDKYCGENGVEWDQEDTTLLNWPYATDGAVGGSIPTSSISSRPHWPKGKIVKKFKEDV